MVRALWIGAGSIVVAMAALGLLQFFRYQPLATQSDPGFLLVWDRLNGRECVTPRAETTTVTGMACNKQELEALNDKIDRAEQVEERRASEAAAAEAYKQALAIAGGDPSIARNVERLRQGGFSDVEISNYAAVQRIAKTHPDLGPRIAQVRAAGGTDAQILTALQHPPAGHSLSNP